MDAIAWVLAHQIPEDEQDEYTKRILEKERRRDDIDSYEVSAEQMTPKDGTNIVSVGYDVLVTI